MSAHEELLHSFQPRLRYDSQEAFFADSAAQMVEARGHRLCRVAPDGSPGEVIAEAGSGLNLVFLRAEGEEYPVGGSVRADDILDDPRRDHRLEAHELHQREDWRNVMYGAVRREPGEEGRVWLQYWFFYLYNDYNLAGGYGLHEGDWEMVQLRLAKPGSAHPIDRVVYAQHTYAEGRAWEEIETEEGAHPVVYVGRGSHASYFESGLHRTEAWWDIADGDRDTPPLRLEVLPDPPPGWAVWPGRWGGTFVHRIKGLEQPSPVGPGAHPQWDDPRALKTQMHATQPLPPTTGVRVRRARNRLRIDFDFARLGDDVPPPERLIVTRNSSDEMRVPPFTDTFVIDRAVRGRVLTRRRLNPEHHYDVRVSTQDADGKATTGAPVELRPASRLVRKLLEALSRLSLRRHGGRA